MAESSAPTFHEERSQAEAADPERQDQSRHADHDRGAPCSRCGHRNPGEEGSQEEKQHAEHATLVDGHGATLLPGKAASTIGEPNLGA